MWNPWKKDDKSPTIEEVVNILGRGRVLSSYIVRSVWGWQGAFNDLVPYPVSTIEQCARENRKNKADWRMVYTIGLSLKHQWEKRGDTREGHIGFFPSHIFDGSYDNETWFGGVHQSSYRLFNFAPSFAKRKWRCQGKLIEKMNANCERPFASMVSECLLSYALSSHEYLLPKQSHSAEKVPFMPSSYKGDCDSEMYLYVSIDTSTGLSIISSTLEFRREDTGVVLLKTPLVGKQK